MEARLLLFSIIFILAFPFLAYSEEEDCTYVIYVHTGPVKDGGTSAKVSLELRDTHYNRLNITNLESRGIMRRGHSYFKQGNLDAFATKGKCFYGPICSITLSHDNAGVSPGWYVDFVDVTTIALHRGCRKLRFPIHGWLAVDKPPRSTRWTVYLCDDVSPRGGGVAKC